MRIGLTEEKYGNLRKLRAMGSLNLLDYEIARRFDYKQADQGEARFGS